MNLFLYIRNYLAEIVTLCIFGALFMILPWSLAQAPMRGCVVMVMAYTLFLLKDRSWLQMLPLMFFLIPQQLSSQESGDVDIMMYSKYFMYFSAFTILMVIYCQRDVVFENQEGHRLPFACTVFLLILSFYYFMAISDDRKDIYDIVYFTLLYLCFYLVLKNKEVSYMLFYYAMDVLFYVLSFYAVTEFFFQTTPYDDLYYSNVSEDYYSIVNFLRVKSLCGHPLLFVAFLVVYQVTLYARVIFTNSKIVYFHFIVMLFISLLTLSRTILIIDVAVFCLYFVLSKRFFPDKKIGYILFLTVFLLVVVAFLGYDIILQSFERFEDSDVSETNRLAAFQAAWVIFQNEPLGVGASLMDMYDVYHSEMPSNFEVDVLDNGFLAILCQYGVFFPVYLIPFLYPLVDTYREIKNNKKCLLVFWLTTVSFFLLSFSFIIVVYTSVLMLLAVSFAVINHLQDGCLDNYSELQHETVDN